MEQENEEDKQPPPVIRRITSRRALAVAEVVPDVSMD